MGRKESLESSAQWKGLALGGVKFTACNRWASEYVDADGGGWVYILVVGSKSSVFSVKERSSAESRAWEQMLGLKERKEIFGPMEKIDLFLIMWSFCSNKCPLWLADLNESETGQHGCTFS